jgi:hypothetical protein
MAGEWIAYDLALPQKPEVQELIDTTGLPVQEVVFNLLQLWGWASLHCADGSARMTLPRLVRTCGATEEFWSAVAGVGWLEIDETVATVAVPGWDRRFSQAAKSRAQEADRKRAYEGANPGRKRPGSPSDGGASDAPDGSPSDDTTPESRRGDRGDRGEVHHHPHEAWGKLLAAWNAGKGRKWTPATPPDGWAERIAEPGWFEVAMDAIGRIDECRYFKTPMTLIQFLKPGWAHKVLGGSFDNEKGQQRGGRDFGDSPAPPKAFTGPEAEAFDRTRRKLAAAKEGL